MQLTLELLTGPNAGETRLVGNGRSFVIGTSAGATWLLPLTAEGRGDVRIEDGHDGLTVRLESGVAYLDQRGLTEDAARPLHPQSILQIAGHQLRAGRTHEPASEGVTAIGTAPTISSILADVAPGGITSDGLVQARSEENWLDTLASSEPARPEWASLGRYQGDAEEAAPLSAPADTPFLPSDWDAPDGAPSDAGNEMTQAEAVAAVLKIGREKDMFLDEAPSPRPDAAVAAFLRACGLLPDEMPGLGARQMEAFGGMLLSLLDAVSEMENAQARLKAELGLADPLQPSAARQPAALLISAAQDPDAALGALEGRLSDLRAAQTALLGGVRSFASEARAQLDPDAVEAHRATEAGVTGRLAPARAAWDIYRRRFEADPAPLSDAALATAIRAHLNERQDKDPYE